MNSGAVGVSRNKTQLNREIHDQERLDDYLLDALEGIEKECRDSCEIEEEDIIFCPETYDHDYYYYAHGK